MRYKDLNRNIKIRIGVNFLSSLCKIMIFPFMAILLSGSLGEALTGVLILVNVILSIISGFVGGYLADRIGRKKVLVAGEFVLIFAFLIMAAANSPWFQSVWITYFMMVVSSICSGMIGPAADAMLIDDSTAENRNYMYSVSYWSTNIAFSVGALIGGAFFKTYPSILFLACAMFAGVGFCLTAFFIRDSYRPIPKSEGSSAGLKSFLQIGAHYRTVWKDTRFLYFIAATVLVLSLEFQMDKYVGVRLAREFHTPFFGYELNGLNMLSLIILLNTVLIVVLTLSLAKRLHTVKTRAVFYFGLAAYTFGYSFMAYSNSMIVLLFAALAFTVGEMIYSPIRQSIMAELVQDNARSSYMAVNGLAFQISSLMGGVGLIVGSYISSAGMSALFIAMGLGAILLFHRSTRKAEAAAPVVQINNAG